MLNGQILTPQMMGQLSSKGIIGSKISSFAGAVSEGIVEGFISKNQVISLDVGIAPAGVGVGTGKMIGLIPNSMLAVAIPALAQQQILGSKSKDLAEAVITSICLHFNQANLSMSQHSFVGVGNGVGKVTDLSPLLMTHNIMSKMVSKGISGEKMFGLVKAICDSFAKNLMATATVNITITGAPLLILGVPVPGSGVGRGKIT